MSTNMSIIQLFIKCKNKHNFFRGSKMSYIGTKAAARILGVTVSRLHQAAWLEKFPPPAKIIGLGKI